MLNEYLLEKGYDVKDTKHSTSTLTFRKDEGDVDEALIMQHLKKEHKVHERLGFGYLALFRTMRFLLLIFAGMAMLMILAGVVDNYADNTAVAGFSFISSHSMANLEYSANVCL